MCRFGSAVAYRDVIAVPKQHVLELLHGTAWSISRRTGLVFQAVLDNLAIKRAAADFEHARRLLLIPLHALEHAHDVSALGFGKRRQPLLRRFNRRFARVQELDVARPDDASRRRQRGPRDRAFELADVARPVILHEQVESFLRERLAVKRQPVGGAIPGEEALGEDRDIDRALAQRRQRGSKTR